MWREIDPADNYLLKIAKLVPVEVTAAYTAINSLLSKDVRNFWVLVICAVILLVTCFFLILWQTNNRSQAYLTAFAFVLWAAFISGFIYLDDRAQALLGCAVVLGSVFLPRLVQKQEG
jgi:FtsH-binding integral membrane protein